MSYMQGYLSSAYKTSFCVTILDQKPCHLGIRCQNAHAVSELRIEAAVAQGKLDPDYKAKFCDDFLTTGEPLCARHCAYLAAACLTI